MDGQSLAFSKSLDSWLVMVVIAAVALVGSALRNRLKARHTRTKPNVPAWPASLETARPNQRATGQRKARA